MKRALATLLAAAALTGCDDAIAPPTPTSIAAVDAPRASITSIVVGGTTYDLVDLGTLGGHYSQSNAINEAGQVTGYSQVPSGEYHAFLMTGGVMTDLGTLGGTYSYPFALNNAGDVTGYSYPSGNPYHHAVLWSGGSITDLGTLPGDVYSYGTAINDTKVVVGISYGGHTQNAFVWNNGVMTQLPSLGGPYSYPTAINSSGDVVGYSYPSTFSFFHHAVLWRNGTAIDLDPAGTSYSYATDINDAGQVTGYIYDALGVHRAFRWENGVMTTLPGDYGVGYAINAGGDIAGYSLNPTIGNYQATLWRGTTATALGSLGGGWSYAFSLNDAGQVTGYSGLTSGQYHTFLWENGIMYDMSDLGGGWSYANPGAINNRGQIAGTSGNASFENHATLWDPSTTPVTIDIKPGTTPNSVNPKSNGVIAVAVLSVGGFDATTVDVATVKFGPGNAAEAHGRGHIEDANGDGVPDLVLHFDTQASGIVCGTTSAKLTGATTTGQNIEGTDAVATTGCK